MPEGRISTSPEIFDRALIRARQRRAAALGPVTFLLDRVADEFADRLAAVMRRFDLAADIGTPNDAVRRALTRLASVGTMITAGSATDEQKNAQKNAIIADDE